MKSLLLTIALISTSAFGSNYIKEITQLTKPASKRTFCKSFKVSKHQKLAIKKVIKKTKLETRNHSLIIKQAKRAMNKALINPNTTKLEAMDSIKDYNKAVRPVRTLSRKAKYEINFDILTGQQRVELLKCKVVRGLKTKRKVKKTKRVKLIKQK